VKQNRYGKFEIMKKVHRHSISLSDPKREIEAVLFDMDGVLVDSIPVHRQAWNSALAEKNLPPLDPRRYSSMLGRTSQDILTGYLELHSLPLPMSSQKEIILSKEQFLLKLLKESIQPTPGVFHWLDFLKQKQILCSIASSGEMGNIVAVLELLDLSGYFASIISGARQPASQIRRFSYWLRPP